jgi:hypothetical protein
MSGIADTTPSSRSSFIPIFKGASKNQLLKEFVPKLGLMRE